MNKFIVTLDVGTREQRNAVTQLFQSQGWKVWHWMEDLWLLSKVPPTITSKIIAELISNAEITGTKTKLVIQIPDSTHSTYWGYGVKASWEWMKEFWGSPG